MTDHTNANDKEYKLHIHNMAFDEKPSKGHIPTINAHITKEVASVTQQELAQLVGVQGRTMVLGLMDGKRKKANFQKQEIVALDFDNEGESYTSIEDILKDDYIQQHASFLYKTFSHKKDHHKFRVVFFLDKPLIKNKQVELLYKWLFRKFPTADTAVKDSSRLFFGGIDATEINYGNEINTLEVDVSDLLKDEKQTTETQTLETEPVQPIKDKKALKLFRSYVERDKENLKEYDHALSVLWVLAKAVKQEEITQKVAYECAEILALDNDKWKQENKIKLLEALQTDLKDFHTVYTFARKFGFSDSTEQDNDLDIIEFSKKVAKELSVTLYKGQLYFKEGNRWIKDKNKLLRAVDSIKELKSYQDNELIQQLHKKATLIEYEHFPIQFANEFMLKNGKILPYSTKKFTPYFLNVDYDPQAYNEDVDNFLNFLTCDRKDLRRVIEDMLGHVLMTHGFPHKVFFFIGEKGGNGKSTFLEMLNSFAGDMRTNVSLENFNDSTMVVDLEGRLVNIGDDINASYLESSSNFKILASGNTIMVRPIYSEPYRLKNKATLIFTANEMPTFKDKTGGIARRLMIIPCDNVVQKADFGIDKKLSTDEAQSYLLNLALKGLKRISQNGGKISYSKTIEKNNQRYLTEGNSMLLYLEEIGIDEDLPDKVIYDDYKTYCKDIGMKPYTKTKFTQELKQHGYEQKRIMRLGRRQSFYLKTGN